MRTTPFVISIIAPVAVFAMAWIAPCDAFAANPTPFALSAPTAECRSLSLDQGNVIGLFTVPDDTQTVSARVLYKQGGSSKGIRFRMMREDADALRAEVDALLSRARSKPIEFRAAVSKAGGCSISEITG
jgi:hypothetical protein